MDNNVALVTGGSSGIGLATAQLFAQNGATVVIASRDAEKGQDALDQIDSKKVTFIPTDVTQADQVQQLVETIVNRFGRLDYAVNNAGDTGIYGKVHEQSEADFDHTININLKSVWLCMKYEITQMLTQETGGSIVTISSVKGFTGVPTYPIYSATKHAVHGLTKSAAVAYAQDRIRINAVCPAAIHTPLLEKALHPIFQKDTPEDDVAAYGAMLPIGRAGQPIEIAEAAVWLCSDAASFITGHMLTADGGSMARGIP